MYHMGDAGHTLMGRFGRELIGNAQMLFLVFVMGSHVLTFSVMLNTLSEHGACTITFQIVGMIVSFIFTIPWTLKRCVLSFDGL
jgi:hypothetical protein